MGMEYELKFRAGEEALEAIQAAYPGAARFAMETTYYDTPGGDFTARRWTVRRRLENGKGVCTIKTPGNGSCRGEWEVTETDIALGVKMLCKLNCPQELAVLAAQGLHPICGAKFTRLAIPLDLGGGDRVELALDSGCLIGGGRTAPLCEVEVELKAGRQEAAAAFSAMLAHRYGLTPEPKSKFRRALELTME